MMSESAPQGWSLVAWTGLVVGAGASGILSWFRLARRHAPHAHATAH
jgi:hypothetical protein